MIFITAVDRSESANVPHSLVTPAIIEDEKLRSKAEGLRKRGREHIKESSANTVQNTRVIYSGWSNSFKIQTKIVYLQLLYITDFIHTPICQSQKNRWNFPSQNITNTYTVLLKGYNSVIVLRIPQTKPGINCCLTTIVVCYMY